MCEGEPEEKLSFAAAPRGALFINKTMGTAKKKQQIITRSGNVCDSHICIIYTRKAKDRRKRKLFTALLAASTVRLNVGFRREVGEWFK